MEEFIGFLIYNKELIFGSVIIFILGLYLPAPKFKLFGRSVGSKIPKQVSEEIESRLNSFIEGLKEANVDGDKNLITNSQLLEHSLKFKKELGLEKKTDSK